MLLLTGPPASGKTAWCLSQLRASLRARETDCVLLLPTATLAEHLRNQLAREGLVFPPSAVSTLSGLVETLAPAVPVAGAAAVELIVRKELDRLPAASRYAAVRDFLGFRRALAAAVTEYAGAGGTCEQLSNADPDFGAMFTEVTTELNQRQLVFRPLQLTRASEAAVQGRRFRRIWITGFTTFTPAEINLLRALATAGDLTVAMTESPRAARAIASLRSFARQEQRCSPVPTEAERVLVTARTAEVEINDIARRILEEVRGGRQFRDIGVLIRSERPYAPGLRTAFERFGIPARFYFASELDAHPAVRYLMALVDAALHGWDHEAGVAVLRMHGSPLQHTGDAWEFEILERLPGRGLGGLAEGAPAEVLDYFQQLALLDEWQHGKALPSVWRARFETMPKLFWPGPVSDGNAAERVALWRGDAAALHAFREAVAEAAAALEAGSGRGSAPAAVNKTVEVSCRDFLDALKTTLRFMSLRLPETRRDVVHVIDAVEARHWRLPVMFVPGLLEQQFPRYHSEDAILPDAVRRRLTAAGVPLETSAERQLEESFLFDLALTRATERTILSYPGLNARGEPALPSFYLQRVQASRAEAAIGALRKPARAPHLPLYPSITTVSLRTELTARHRAFSPSSIESYLQCPFKFFGSRTLRLNERPRRIWDRFDAAVQGNIAHRVFELCFRDGHDAHRAFHDTFMDHCVKERIPDGYRTEAIRLELLHAVHGLLAERKIPARNSRDEFEQSFEFSLADGTIVKGKYDRLQADGQNRALLLDYKYKRDYRLRDAVADPEGAMRIQAGLYLLAAQSRGYTPAGMLYCGFRREVSLRGWVLHGLYPSIKETCSNAELQDILVGAQERTMEVAAGVREGAIAPAPSEPDNCQWCSYEQVCRVEVLQHPQAEDAHGA